MNEFWRGPAPSDPPADPEIARAWLDHTRHLLEDAAARRAEREREGHGA